VEAGRGLDPTGVADHRFDVSRETSAFPPMSTAEDIAKGAARLALRLDQSAVDTLATFASGLSSRGVELGVISRSDADNVVNRHVLDSLRSARALRSNDHTAYDLGSGGGLPGIPVAIARPQIHVTLVEARRLRAAWLELLVRDLDLPNAAVVHGRIEDLVDPVDVCLARALGPLDRCWAAAQPLLGPGGRLVYFAGAGFNAVRFSDIPAEIHILDEPDLESGGPLVIIGPQ
jgi:16S rRNA (guanine527-N7)-methyltransferase